MRSLLDAAKNCDAHHRVFAALAAAGLAALLTWGRYRLPVQIVLVWDVFLAGILGLAWMRIVTAHPKDSSETARLQDSSQTAIFIFVVLAAVMSIVAIGYLFSTAHGRHGERLLLAPMLTAFATLIGSWSLIHTLFALRYAHIYYGDANGPESPPEHRGGLQFPGKRPPDYLDFAYFAFVIGMTCQVSDVQISERRMRRLVLAHGLLSFGFNTVILALSLNIFSGLLAN